MQRTLVGGETKNVLLRRLLSVLLIVIIPLCSQGQGYRIELQIDGLNDEALFLGYYLNGKTYIQDTADYVEPGKYILEGSKVLKKGMYFLAKNTTLLFDLVIGNDQQFSLKTSIDDYLNTMRVAGNQENTLFFENMIFNVERSKEAAPHLAILKDSTASPTVRTAAQEAMSAINAKVAAYQSEVVDTYPKSIVSTLFNMNKRPEIPKEMSDDKSRSLYYYRAHYWDFFDLGDPVLLRVPNTVYKQKVDEYLDNLIVPKVDSVIVAVDQLIGSAKKNEDTYQTLVWHLTLKYQTSNVLGFDEIYVYLLDTYFLTGEMDYWANEQLKKNLKEKADQYRNSLIGMIAPNLVLQDLNKLPKALHDLSNTYSIIYFYDPDCGHCKKETPILRAFVDTTPYDVGVYTVSADTSMTKMRTYIAEMELGSWTNTNGTRTYGINYQEVFDAFTTPTIYLLNERKEIIAKKIAASQLSGFIESYEKSQQK